MSTLKSLTKAELVALLQERNATIEALRLEVSTLQGSIALRSQPQATTPARAAYLAQRAERAERGAGGPTPFQLACAAAKAMALASGRAVRVTT